MNPGWHKVLREWGEALIYAFILALFIRTFALQAFKIPTGSMLNTLLIGDQLLVNKFIYGIKIPFTDYTLIPISDPKRHDIVVFKYPADPGQDYIKRIIGLPGDTVEIRNKKVFINNTPQEESFTRFVDARVREIQCPSPPSIVDSSCLCRDNIAPFTVPKEKYFMMGDNRDSSLDSRCWGFVDRKAIVGKAWRIYWSWSGLSDIRFSRIGRLIE